MSTRTRPVTSSSSQLSCLCRMERASSSPARRIRRVTDITLPADPKTKLNVYTGDFTIEARLVASAGNHLVQAKLRYQACNDQPVSPAQNHHCACGRHREVGAVVVCSWPTTLRTCRKHARTQQNGIPQGLKSPQRQRPVAGDPEKPHSFWELYCTAKAVPFSQNTAYTYFEFPVPYFFFFAFAPAFFAARPRFLRLSLPMLGWNRRHVWADALHLRVDHLVLNRPRRCRPHNAGCGSVVTSSVDAI